MYIATLTAVVASVCELLEPYRAVECEVLNISKDISAFKTPGTTQWQSATPRRPESSTKLL
jgi:hypothetical protein